MFMGYKAKAFVCLECGFLGHYVDKRDIAELQDRRT